MDGRQLIHLEVELERDAKRVLRAQGAALERLLHEACRQTLSSEPGMRPVQILFAEHLEAQQVGASVCALL